MTTTTTTTGRWTQMRGRVLHQRDYGTGHHWLEIEVPAEFGLPEPGQFIQIQLAPPSPVFLPRPMSVAAATRRRRTLEIGFLYAPVGVGTRALASLGADAPIEVLGPLGHGFPLERPGTRVLMAGGRGVAPLLFAADRLAGKGERCDLLFGARSAEHLVGLSEARARLTRAGGRLHLCTDDGSRGRRGNVVALLESLAPKLAAPIVIHACGPHAMLHAIAEWAMRRGVEAHLAMESVMACGTGVCRGCPLPRSSAARAVFDSAGTPSLFGNREFAMCCTEGPVFESRQLDWERIE